MDTVPLETKTSLSESVSETRPPTQRSTSTDPDPAQVQDHDSPLLRGSGSVALLAGILIAIVVAKDHLAAFLDAPSIQTWATVFISLVIQALPFLALGVVISALIAVFVPARVFDRILPSSPAAAVPVAGAAGLLLPGCECGSVPIAGGLIRRGVAPAAALTFLLAAPAINPVVLVATAVAFPGTPEMVLARAVASIIAATVMGWLWLAMGKREWIRLPARRSVDGANKVETFFATMRHDFIAAGGMLVLGAAAAGLLKIVVPAQWLTVVADNPWLSLLVLGILAVVMSLCSEADAFVAASLSQFSLTSRLVFLVVGPMIDLKLFAMQVGMFGRRFAARFAPTTFVVATVSASVVGWILL